MGERKSDVGGQHNGNQREMNPTLYGLSRDLAPQCLGILYGTGMGEKVMLEGSTMVTRERSTPPYGLSQDLTPQCLGILRDRHGRKIDVGEQQHNGNN
jgi:hypothetical protein